MIRRAGGKSVAVGYDGRLSSPMLADALISGINAAEVDALNVGLGPTPMLYYAASTEDVAGGIQITGSHNPPDYNGFQMVFQGRPFFGAAIQAIGEMAAAGDWESVDSGKEGTAQSIDIGEAYVDRKSVGGDMRVAVRVDLGGLRIIKKKK